VRRVPNRMDQGTQLVPLLQLVRITKSLSEDCKERFSLAAVTAANKRKQRAGNRLGMSDCNIVKSNLKRTHACHT